MDILCAALILAGLVALVVAIYLFEKGVPPESDTDWIDRQW